MRILICDDDHFSIEKLKQYLEEYFTENDYDLPEFVSFSDGDSLLADEGKKDMVFLDIEMPGSNGILVSNELKRINPDIIIFIITFHDQYLDEAMDVHAFRYLSKPLDKNRLFAGMNRAMRTYFNLISSVIIDNGKTSVKMSEAEIIYIEAQARTTLVHTVSGVYPAKKAIHAWMNTLNAGSFFQTHKSYIVNMKHVSSFTNELISFSSCQNHAYLSRRKYKEFKKAYFIYIGQSH